MIKRILSKINRKIFHQLYLNDEKQKLLLGRILSNQIKSQNSINLLKDVEFSIFSQFGDDGIIQWLVNNLNINNNVFVEFGVEDYKESNTRFLMMNDNWSGFIMDGDERNIQSVQSSDYYWKYDLTSKAEFIDEDNINELITKQKLPDEIGLLHIDLDGNDYYIWEAINMPVEPSIVIVEYNSIFGADRSISVPYDDSFQRSKAHYSNLFWGTSLKSLYLLATKKGYGFIGCNSSGNNAYFVRKDLLNENVQEVSLDTGFVDSKYREARDENGNLTFKPKGEMRKLLKGLKVYNTETKELELF